MSTALPSLLAAIAVRSWKKTVRRPVTLAFSLLQPIVWMVFFGFLMRRAVIELPAGLDYPSFLVPGICAMTVLFGASQAGISVVRDIQTGILQRMLATPAPRWILHLGKVAADGVRLLVQAMIVLLIGLAVGASLSFALLPLLLSFAGLFVFAVGFSSLSCIIAIRSGRPETMATFVHVINMPVFFTSTALVPDKQMPEWLAAIARWNPLTLTVESLRGALLFEQTPSITAQILPVAVLSLLLVMLAVRELPRALAISPWEAR